MTQYFYIMALKLCIYLERLIKICQIIKNQHFNHLSIKNAKNIPKYE